MRLLGMHVEEGFLDRLNLAFQPGLNVLIGPRGTGKTSVIELIRFGLGLEPLTARAKAASEEHVRSILGSGRVTLDMEVDGATFSVTRSIDDAQPRTEGALSPAPIVLAQNEIESVAIDARGRLRLIDAFRPGSAVRGQGETALLAQIASVCVDISGVARAITETTARWEALANVPGELANAEEAERALGVGTAGQKKQQARLDQLGRQSAALAVEAEYLLAAASTAKQYAARLADERTHVPALGSWPSSGVLPPEVTSLTTELSRAAEAIAGIEGGITAAANLVEESGRARSDQRPALEDEARRLRQIAEQAQAGAGAAARLVADLRRKSAERLALQQKMKDRQAELSMLQDRRDTLLDRLDQMRETRFAERSAAARELNERLGPHIEVALERYGMQAEYASVIAGSLHGSQLHYSTLAPELAAAFSPRELVAAAESDDVAAITSRTAIKDERARKLLAHLREQPLEKVLTASLEDAVELRLLVGNDMKATEHLSTGQRCTVVLPLLMSHEDRVLVVDQPEDHLDNAFVAGTVVPAIAERGSDSQLIFATHNANVPVLGEASQVVCMGSDGRRGFVRCAGDLDDAEIVESITSVMEGGREAFERRAAFYRDH